MRDHRLIDERSLAFDKLIASKLRAEPTLAEKARTNLCRWMLSADPAVQPVLSEWQGVLDGPMDALLATLEGMDERAVRLRQSSPFCGILAREERTRLLQEFHRREPHAA